MEETENKKLIELIEGISILRRFFLRRCSNDSPLHFSQVAIMLTIEKHENCTQSVIAEQLNVSPASVATSTKRLQKAGFITKTVDKDNLRCKRLSLTDKGREVIRNQRQIFDDYDSLIFSCFSEKEKEELYGYLYRLFSEIKKIGGSEAIDKMKFPFKLNCCTLEEIISGNSGTPPEIE